MAKKKLLGKKAMKQTRGGGTGDESQGQSNSPRPARVSRGGRGNALGGGRKAVGAVYG